MEKSPKRRRSSGSRHSSSSKRSRNSPDVEEKKKKQEGESSPARCPICLAMPENKAKSESCSHYFCYSCLKEWSKVKAECPLCKIPFTSIFYNIKSEQEFEEYHVKTARNNHMSDHMPSASVLSTFDNWWYFQIHEYRNQLRRRHENTLAAEQACSDIAVIRKRRMYYWHKTKVSTVRTGNRVRDITPLFFQENPSQMHRLEPWLRRELTVLYGAHNRLLIRRVRDLIASAIPTYGITSRSFYRTIQPYLLDHTAQFIHEFTAFAKSPYDIQQYDRHAVYDTPSAVAGENQQRPSSPSREPGRRATRNPLRSRWDDSPDSADNVPGAPTSQSVMLSQTSWGDDLTPMFPELNPPRVTLPAVIDSRQGGIGSTDATPPIGSMEYRNPTPPRDFPVTHAEPNTYTNLMRLHHRRHHTFHHRPSHNAYVEAPLVHRSLEDHRSSVSARHYERMEIMRRHFDRFSSHRRASQVRHRRRQQRRSRWEAPGPASNSQSNPLEVIVISSDSSDKEAESSSVYRNGSQTLLHYRPTPNQQKQQQQPPQQRSTVIKEEKPAESSSSSDSSSEEENENNAESSGSDIEFVKYIKPPHLRTPDAFINLDSSDDDKPGPSKRHSDVILPVKKQPWKSSSSSSSSSSDWSARGEEKPDQRPPAAALISDLIGRTNSLLQKTQNFLDSVSCPSHNNAVMSSTDNVMNMKLMAASNPMPAVNMDLSDTTESAIQSTPHGVMTSPTAILTSNTDGTSPYVDVTSSPTPIVGNEVSSTSNDDSSRTLQHSDTNSSNSAPKKVFERGKVSVNFESFTKRNNQFINDSSDSDYELDVGVEEIPTFFTPRRGSRDPRPNSPRRGDVREHGISSNDQTVVLPDHDEVYEGIIGSCEHRPVSSNHSDVCDLSINSHEHHSPNHSHKQKIISPRSSNNSYRTLDDASRSRNSSSSGSIRTKDQRSRSFSLSSSINLNEYEGNEKVSSSREVPHGSSHESPKHHHRQSSSHGFSKRKKRKHHRKHSHKSHRREKDSPRGEFKKHHDDDDCGSRKRRSRNHDQSHKRRKKSSKHRRSRSSSVEFVSLIRS